MTKSDGKVRLNRIIPKKIKKVTGSKHNFENVTSGTSVNSWKATGKIQKYKCPGIINENNDYIKE